MATLTQLIEPTTISLYAAPCVQHSKLLSLPVEIRFKIYAELFKSSKIVLDGGDNAQSSCFLASSAEPITVPPSRSSQILRTCKTILYEARPVLYSGTVFHVIRHTYAGILPSSFSDGHASSRQIRHIVWQVDSDILKRWYEDDAKFDQPEEWENLASLEIRCRVDSWRGSYCGDLDQRAAFTTGREQLLQYGAWLRQHMKSGDTQAFCMLTENRRFHGKGEVRIKLSNRCTSLESDEVVVEAMDSESDQHD